MIAIIEYGVGNVASVQNALRRLGEDAVVTSETGVLEAAEALILPGVGAFGEAMRKLRAASLDNLIRRRVAGGTPLLGICLGMQLFFDRSDEGSGSEGLGLIKGEVVKFRDVPKIPHMGWNRLRVRDSGMFAGADGGYFYFVHSYHCVPGDSSDVLGTADYGGEFVAAVKKDNVLGLQFHPEKSGEAGLRLLRSFIEEEVRQCR